MEQLREASDHNRDNFMRFVEDGPADECWAWRGGKGPYGYGRYELPKGRATGAHRVSLELAIGKLRPGECACHRCDNPICVNPDHLFAATQSENVKDRHAKGRTANSLTGAWAALARAAGGVGAMASTLGVHRTTIRKWAKSPSTLRGVTRVALRAFAKSLGVECPV